MNNTLNMNNIFNMNINIMWRAAFALQDQCRTPCAGLQERRIQFQAAQRFVWRPVQQGTISVAQAALCQSQVSRPLESRVPTVTQDQCHTPFAGQQERRIQFQAARRLALRQVMWMLTS